MGLSKHFFRYFRNIYLESFEIFEVHQTKKKLGNNYLEKIIFPNPNNILRTNSRMLHQIQDQNLRGIIQDEKSKMKIGDQDQDFQIVRLFVYQKWSKMRLGHKNSGMGQKVGFPRYPKTKTYEICPMGDGRPRFEIYSVDLEHRVELWMSPTLALRAGRIHHCR